MNAKTKPATTLTPFQQFYGTPTPSNAIKLALADSFAYVAPMMPDGEYVKMLHKAEERCDAYPQLVAALRDSTRALKSKPSKFLTVAEQGAMVAGERLLRSLGEEQ